MTVTTKHAFEASFDKLYSCLTDEDFLYARNTKESALVRWILKNVARMMMSFVSNGREKVPSNPPGFARKVLSEWNQLKEIMEWSLEADGSAHANYLCKVSGVPGELRGEFDLSPDGDGCVEDIVMQANIKIPLLGKKNRCLHRGRCAD